jgi:hypothetical protein
MSTSPEKAVGLGYGTRDEKEKLTSTTSCTDRTRYLIVSKKGKKGSMYIGSQRRANGVLLMAGLRFWWSYCCVSPWLALIRPRAERPLLLMIRNIGKLTFSEGKGKYGLKLTVTTQLRLKVCPGNHASRIYVL